MLQVEIEKKQIFIKNEETIIGDYDFEKQLNYLPEAILDTMKEPNKDFFSNNNESLKKFVDNKNKYKYIASVKGKARKDKFLLEYYQDLNSDCIYAYLSTKYKRKYYLNAVAIYRRKSTIVM